MHAAAASATGASSWGSSYCTGAKAAEPESFRTLCHAIANALSVAVGVHRGRKAIVLDYLSNDATLQRTCYANRKRFHRTACWTVTKLRHHHRGYF